MAAESLPKREASNVVVPPVTVSNLSDSFPMGDSSARTVQGGLGQLDRLVRPTSVGKSGGEITTVSATGEPPPDAEKVVGPASLVKFDEISRAIVPHLEGLLSGGKGLDEDARVALSRKVLSTAFDVPKYHALLDTHVAGDPDSLPAEPILPGWERFTEFDPGGGGDSTFLKITEHRLDASSDDPTAPEALVTTISRTQDHIGITLRKLLPDGSEVLGVSLSPDSHWVHHATTDDMSVTEKRVSSTLRTSPSGEIIYHTTRKN